MIDDSDHRAGSNPFGGNDVGAVDPNVSGFHAVGTAGGNFHCRETWVLGHAVILTACGSDDENGSLCARRTEQWLRFAQSKIDRAAVDGQQGAAVPPKLLAGGLFGRRDGDVRFDVRTGGGFVTG